MGLEEELQQTKEASRLLEDKLAKTELDYIIKEVFILRFFGPISNAFWTYFQARN
jgi:hypothetical protein